MPRKLFIETFGCQMNVLDSELVVGQLLSRGFETTPDRDRADVVIYNTCSVREHAEQKVWSRLGELRDARTLKPELVIGVIGCMAERDSTNIFQRFPHVDILCGPAELDKLPAMVVNAVTQRVEAASNTRAPALSAQRQVALMGSTARRSSTQDAAREIDSLESLDLSRAISPADEQTQAYVRITRGCNKFCTYCVVPYTRGEEVHRPPANIIDEVRKLADAGIMEVTLLGQTINHYAFNHGDGRETSFAELLHQIHEAVPHLPRLRFVTSFPRDFTDEALQAMRDCERICRYLHAPAQHGNDRILKLMNRGYTAQQYRDFVGRARQYMPDVTIASDFIVGFPTETDNEFDQTMLLVRDCRFKNSFIFKYSPRPGTVAIKRFDDDIPDVVKKRRNNDLLAVQGEISLELNRALIGQSVEVIVEGQSKLVSKRTAYPSSNVELGKGFGPRDQGDATVQLVGRTRGDHIIVFDGTPELIGRIVEVDVVDAQSMTVFGRLPATVEA
jgi:tRNA-2-methylthio-N6-dimethylallyladenosine synthase